MEPRRSYERTVRRLRQTRSIGDVCTDQNAKAVGAVRRVGGGPVFDEIAGLGAVRKTAENCASSQWIAVFGRGRESGAGATVAGSEGTGSYAEHDIGGASRTEACAALSCALNLARQSPIKRI
jgi:hypothetical protein